MVKGQPLMPRFETLGYDHVNLQCRDIARSLRFYTEVLNLPLCRCDRNTAGEITFVSVQAGPAIVDLMPRPAYVPPPAQQAGMNHFALEIAPCDADHLAADLRAQGVEVYEGPVRRQGAKGMGMAVYLRDPDGHGIELKQYEDGDVGGAPRP
jgi:glyoxylase I family protein